MASKAAGLNNGVSKNSRLVIMKATVSMVDVTWAFSSALRDIRDKSRTGKSVVVLPWTSASAFNQDRTDWGWDWEALKLIMADLLAEQTVIVVSAGNFADRSDLIDTLPAIWEQNPASFFVNSNLFVTAGAVTTWGAESSFSQKGRDTIWGPGEKVKCAGLSGVQTATGTSFSAPMVSRVMC